VKTVLLIEDNALDAMLFEHYLRDHAPNEYRIEHFDRLASGLRRMMKGDIDIVMVDLCLPDSMGVESLDEIKAVSATTPVVVLTELVDEATATRAVQLGAQDYLLKSEVDGSLIARCLRYSIERKRSEVALRNRKEEVVRTQAALEANAAVAEDLRTAKERAELANQAKGEFLTNMSHELRTPLHGILSFAKLGRDRASALSPEHLADYFSQIHDSGQTLLSLLNNLLDLGKLDSGQMEFEPSPVAMVPILKETMAELSAWAEESSLKLSLWGSDDLWVNGDATRMKQVVRNLLGNAIKFSSEESTVELKLFVSDENARLEVRDSGPGVPENEQYSIFEQFVQSSATKTSAGGTGLGLAICKEIIEAHGGCIGVENIDPMGANFFFELPLCHQKAGIA